MTQSLSEQQLSACPIHPEVTTNLRCSKCESLICPRCLVQTPVGARCRECAQLRRLPIFEVGLGHYLRATGASLGLALVAGLVWGAIPFGGFFAFMVSPLAGYAIGEGVSRAVNRRRSFGLKLLAAAGVILAYLIARGGVTAPSAAALLAAGAPGLLLELLLASVLSTLLNPFAWLVIAIGAYVATTRVG